MKRSAPLRRTRLAARSPRRAAEDAAYRQVVAAVFRRDRDCRAAHLGGCRGAHHPHHVWPVGEGGPRADPANIVRLCAYHHRWVHTYRAHAETTGLIRRCPLPEGLPPLERPPSAPSTPSADTSA